MRIRDPDIALYDSACNLLMAAQELRRTAEDVGPEAALPPVLGCLQETLQELGRTCQTISARSGTRGRRRGGPGRASAA